jgi:hypothetical protein
MKVTQVKLSNVGHPEKMVCWLPSEKYRLKVGMILSLDDVLGLWQIEEIYTSQDHYDINRKWNVGGL